MIQSNGQPSQNGEPAGSGDLGGAAAPLERRDLHKLDMLVRSGRWIMPEHLNEAMPRELWSMARGENGESERHRLMAMRILSGLEGQNQNDELAVIRAKTAILERNEIHVHYGRHEPNLIEGD